MDAVGTLIVAAIGAFFANFASKYVEAIFRRGQANETQRDADLQDLISAARSIGELSEKFWTKSAAELQTEDHVLRAHLMARQHTIAGLVQVLFDGSNKGDSDMHMHRLFKSATGGNFGEPDREAEPGRLTEILIAVDGLVHSAKAARRKIARYFFA